MKNFKISIKEYEFFLKKYTTNQFKYVAKTGGRPIPLMVEGVHGIGKTKVLESFLAKEKIPNVIVSAGQLAEVGDLTGIPRLGENGYTVCMPPQFIFRLKAEIAESLGKTSMTLTDEEYQTARCVLTFDDITRTNGTVLNGLMQLFQDGAMLDWKLPKNCILVATCNPEDTQQSTESDAQFFYSVESLDPAQKTRFCWVTVEASLSATAMHLCQKYGVETLGIFLQQDELLKLMSSVSPRQIGNFMTMCYDSWVEIDKTVAAGGTMESAAKHFDEIIFAANIATNQQFVAAISAFAARKMSFPQIMGYLFDPQVNAENTIRKIKELAKESKLDMVLWTAFITTLFVDSDIVFQRITEDNFQFFKERLLNFLKMEVLNNDARVKIAKAITKNTDAKIKTLMADKELSMILLKNI